MLLADRATLIRILMSEHYACTNIQQGTNVSLIQCLIHESKRPEQSCKSIIFIYVT